MVRIAYSGPFSDIFLRWVMKSRDSRNPTTGINGYVEIAASSFEMITWSFVIAACCFEVADVVLEEAEMAPTVAAFGAFETHRWSDPDGEPLSGRIPFPIQPHGSAWVSTP